MKPLPREVVNLLYELSGLEDDIRALMDAVIVLAGNTGERVYDRSIELIQRQIVTLANQQGEILAQVNCATGVYYRDVSSAVRVARALEVERRLNLNL